MESLERRIRRLVESLPDISNCFGGRFAGRTVLMTGHTGFKGSWLCLWLKALGARVVGYSLPAPTDPNHFQLLNLDVESHLGDVRDLESLTSVFKSVCPELVLHLAAQPLVRLSYDQPVETFTSNVSGTVNVLQAARAVDSVRAIVCVTSDKVYENVESEIGYCETDRLGGADPYSCSKACAELIVKSYRESFFSIKHYGIKHETLIATARAGNVFGGGDWALDRLVPDAIRAAVAREAVSIRNPHSVRPWQHVLEPLAGYLLLSDRLLDGQKVFAREWNFGPGAEDNVSVGSIVNEMQNAWPSVTVNSPENVNPQGPHETSMLKLDSTLARESLNWLPVWDWQQSVRKTTQWYQRFYDSNVANSQDDLNQYVRDAESLGLEWAVQ